MALYWYVVQIIHDDDNSAFNKSGYYWHVINVILTTMLCYVVMGVQVIKLDDHPDHNKTNPFIDATTLQSRQR